ncbi:unnamed protein product [Pylaiella littoralis]
MALYRLGHGAGVRATAALFGVSDGWVCVTNEGFREEGLRNLTPRSLVWPTRNEKDCIADAFEKLTGFSYRGQRWYVSAGLPRSGSMWRCGSLAVVPTEQAHR